MDHLPEFNQTSLNSVLQQQKLVLIDFWAPSCAPCLAMMPLLQKINQDHAGLSLVKVNADDQAELAEAYQVRSLPLLVLLADGVEAGRLQGVVGESQILTLLAPFLTTETEQRCAEIAEQRQQTSLSRQQLDQAIDELNKALAEAPDKGTIRALLIHCYLDRALLLDNKEGFVAAEALLQATDFSWLRSPQVQQASSRLQLLNGRHFDPEDSELYPLVASEQYDQAAERVLCRIELQGAELTAYQLEQQQSLLFRLLDTLADRKRANELRRRLVQFLARFEKAK